MIELLLLVLIGVLGTYTCLRPRHRRLAPLPPSPPRHPLLGHLLKFPPSRQYELLVKWAAQYGDIFHLHILGQPLVVVNTLKVAIDLMEKRSANYSDRPPCHMIELVGFERDLVITPYGDRFRKHRRMFQDTFNRKSSSSFQGIQIRQANALLKRLLSEPSAYHSHLQTFVLGTVFEVAYGHRVDSDEDRYLQLFKKAAPAMEEVSAGIAMLDFLPWLAHVPPWVPILSVYSNVIRKWRSSLRAAIEIPFKDLRAQLADGSSHSSFSASQLHRLNAGGGEISPDDLKDVEGAAGLILGAGTETTVSSLEIFILVMILFPEAQRKAQEEIDRVVGQDRLPDFNDRNDLPYVNCLIEEIIRWHPVVPLSIPHRTLYDDEYDGMHIPGGSTIIPNVQVMAKDPSVYRDADAFYPERFLPSPAGYEEPLFDAAFGFGRRKCPGRHLARDSLWIAASAILATLKIGKAIGDDGNVIEPRVEWIIEAQTSPPKHFDCHIKPRTKTAENLIFDDAMI